MSEPTQKSLDEAHELMKRFPHAQYYEFAAAIALKFDAIRAEERAKREREERARQGHTEFCVPKEKAEKLAQALRKHYPSIAGRVIQLQNAGEEKAAAEWNEVAKDFNEALRALEGAHHG